MQQLTHLTYNQVWAACTDAATRNMRANGRTSWNSEDYELAVKELQRLWPEPANPIQA